MKARTTKIIIFNTFEFVVHIPLGSTILVDEQQGIGLYTGVHFVIKPDEYEFFGQS